MLKGILTKIKQGLKTFKPSEEKIARFILDNPDRAIGLSITDLANFSGTSEASVVRFCKTLDLKGYKDLKLSISYDLSTSSDKEGIIHEKIKIGDKPNDILAKISAGSMQAIEDTKEVLSLDNLEKAIDKISESKRIYIFGIGASAIVGLDLQYKFMRINIPTFAFLDSDMQLTSATNMEEGDVAIGISTSGRTKDVIEALKEGKKRGATTIAITQYGQSPILEFSDIDLFIAYVENTFRSGAMASRIAQLNLIDTIFMGVAAKRHNQVFESLKDTREIVEDKKY
ncbi:MurR/RpiR family transcriptional regulator [Halonatronum saccharophilum]|uniref:MurR/RpiR family transcriptional regulator n=1 Tax=Halonatronum saccharophilum TaxID=150060 RepID=UPI0004B80F48|nr:MurR/RpiR family transcriptional regulator [Halonatronum saccharophilum]